MKTLDWIQWLLEHGWKLHYSDQRWAGLSSHWEWTSPEGESGEDYWSDRFDVLPDKVVQFIKQANPPMRISD